MTKLLYIGTAVTAIKNGGDAGHYRNEKALSSIFGGNFSKFTLPSNDSVFSKILSLFFLFPKNLSPKIIRDCVDYVKKAAPEWVFVSSSQYGRLTKRLSKISGIKIITFFHNIETEYARKYISLLKPHTLFFYLMILTGERLASKYSDFCVCITEKDRAALKHLYKKECRAVIPVTMDDKLKGFDFPVELNNKIQNKKCLFVGFNFWGNTQGLSWFIKEVLPSTDIKLIIVGTGMTKAYGNTEKITVHDYVEELSQFYFDADFVISPIISGGGMKTKIAEALMYGKAIIGTEEAFAGYDIADNGKIFVCNTKDDFLTAIKNIYKKDIYYFNSDVRNIFLSNYDTAGAEDKFRRLFDLPQGF